MYRIKLTCPNVPANAGAQAAADITEDFKQRPWHENTRCTWDGQRLVLEAENDFDADGMALLDEFQDEICACTSELFDVNISVESVTEFDKE
jgi:hypothetical protein